MIELEKYVADGFGSSLIERTYKIMNMEIAVFEGNGPFDEAQSYCTKGLSNFNLVSKNGQILDYGIEIVSSAFPVGRKIFDYPRILAAAFFRFATEGPMAPGNVLIDAVKNFCPTIENKPHLYFTLPPYYWNHSFDDLKVGGKTIRFLCGFPIAENEYKVLKDKGYDFFEDFLVESQVDSFNVDRAPIEIH